MAMGSNFLETFYYRISCIRTTFHLIFQNFLCMNEDNLKYFCKRQTLTMLQKLENGQLLSRKPKIQNLKGLFRFKAQISEHHKIANEKSEGRFVHLSVTPIAW